MDRDALAAAVRDLAPGLTVEAAGPELELKVPREAFRALMERLHGDPALALDYPRSMTAVDWPEAGVITCVYHLFSMAHRHGLVVKVDAARADPRVPTVSDLWKGCDWFEREVFDLYGVVFEEHPDLRRIMLTDDWVGYPLRKDYRDSRIAGKTV